jgi:hypothetical protein
MSQRFSLTQLPIEKGAKVRMRIIGTGRDSTEIVSLSLSPLSLSCNLQVGVGSFCVVSERGWDISVFFFSVRDCDNKGRLAGSTLIHVIAGFLCRPNLGAGLPRGERRAYILYKRIHVIYNLNS